MKLSRFDTRFTLPKSLPVKFFNKLPSLSITPLDIFSALYASTSAFSPSSFLALSSEVMALLYSLNPLMILLYLFDVPNSGAFLLASSKNLSPPSSLLL